MPHCRRGNPQTTGRKPGDSAYFFTRHSAKLCRKSGEDLEQVQTLLGHASIQTTEKCLGMQQNLVEAVNDKLRIVEVDTE